MRNRKATSPLFFLIIIFLKTTASYYQNTAMAFSSFVNLSHRQTLFHRPQKIAKLRRRAHPFTTTKSRIIMMPEGPEVRSLVHQLQDGVGYQLADLKFVSGRYTNTIPTGFTEFVNHMKNHNNVITSCSCKGKFIYFLFDQEETASYSSDPDYLRSMWITLGLSGRFLSETAHQQHNRPERWYMELTNSEQTRRKIYYHDSRNFGTLRFSQSRRELMDKLASLGPDIFQLSENEFVQILRQQKPQLNICKFLMDQSKLAGIGNYMLAEGLYRAAIDPFATVEELDNIQAPLLFRELQAVALESYQAQTSNDRTFELQCYGRKVCARAQQPVQRDTNGPHGRTIWYVESQLFMPVIERTKPTMRQNSTHASSSPSTNATETLLATLTQQSWKQHLENIIYSDTFERLARFLQEEGAAGVTIYPPQSDIFAALNLCPFDQVKVVIVGQDPYHGPGQGHGLAFSVRKGVPPPPSLQNIFRELQNDVGIATPTHGNLESWARQGVLLLNTVLTVRRGEANSHARQGWEEFTDEIIQRLNDDRQGLVFLLWGNPAQKKASGVDETKHTMIKTSHPSPLGATKTASPFLGSRCFSRANAALIERGMDPIDWNVDDE